ncbi:hypothetical protein CLV98_108145 [Dyadobacter jejuensis]|uniref:Uncharacterized protein n=1 Tax=Dyadobacter jejuensis TaxID=1082580 RepID=A0A316AHK8_9BACT|nr:hypothetical protein [Dyadobacter jejuensis]PWJ57225.1 hypothetical protein CLV98_108145 [Dyadobacter jejuensis]
MRIWTMLMAVLIFGACQSEKVGELQQDVVERDAKWVNMLAADGCSWHFQVFQADSTIASLVASEASLKLIEAELGSLESSYSTTNVRLRYSRTGNKREVTCGWGTLLPMDEIKVVSIQKQ